MVLLLVLILGGLAFLAERRWPARPLRRVRGWWPRVFALNLGQLGAVLLVGRSLDPWLRQSAHGLAGWSPWSQGVAAYLVSCVAYYLWHRARHASPSLWRWVHQTHHAPERIEVAMAFYKHPLEALANGVLSSALAYGLLGCSSEGAAVYTLLAGAAELFYHLNLRTPVWLGYWIQRPEMHRVHHERGSHSRNYADLPLLDILGGTFYNPGPEEEVQCGLGPALEDRFEDQLLGRDLEQIANQPPTRFLPSWLGAGEEVARD